jgi:hypothetical protein
MTNHRFLHLLNTNPRFLHSKRHLHHAHHPKKHSEQEHREPARQETVGGEITHKMRRPAPLKFKI